MFGKKKAEKQPEPVIRGWREHDLNMLAATLTSDRPNIRTTITGFRQGITVDGDGYFSKLRGLRSDHKMYQQSALLFDDVPGDERLVPMMQQENELFGTCMFNRVRVKGNFGIASNFDDLDDCEMGWANITVLDDLDGNGRVPLLQFRFTVSTAEEQRILQDAFRGSAQAAGSYLNLSVNKVDDIDDWLTQFREDGYSPTLRVNWVYVGAEVGRGPFD